MIVRLCKSGPFAAAGQFTEAGQFTGGVLFIGGVPLIGGVPFIEVEQSFDGEQLYAVGTIAAAIVTRTIKIAAEALTMVAEFIVAEFIAVALS